MNNKTSRIGKWIWLLAAAAGLAAGNAGLAAETVLALRGATIETVGKAGRIEGGTIVVVGDKIQAVGRDVEIPENARVIDLRGKTVLPGLVDPYHAIRLAGTAAPQTRTIVVGGRTIVVGSSSSSSTRFLRIVDSFYPYDADFRPLLRSGITAANLVASGHGQAALARMTVDRPEALIADGEGPIFAAASNDTTSLNVLRNGLASAQAKPAADGASTSSSSSSAPSSSRSTPSSSSSRLSAVEKTLWKDVAAGKRPLLVNAYGAAAILHVLRALEPHDKVQLVLIATGPSVYETLDQLKQRKLSLILEPTIDLAPHTRDRVCVPRLAYEAKIPLALSLSVSQSSLAASQDAPLVPVAFLVKAGLPRQAALEALTKTPARLLGVADRLGSIEARKTANLLVFDGDPLDVASRLERVFVEGRQVYED